MQVSVGIVLIRWSESLMQWSSSEVLTSSSAGIDDLEFETCNLSLPETQFNAAVIDCRLAKAAENPRWSEKINTFYYFLLHQFNFKIVIK